MCVCVCVCVCGVCGVCVCVCGVCVCVVCVCVSIPKRSLFPIRYFHVRFFIVSVHLIFSITNTNNLNKGCNIVECQATTISSEIPLSLPKAIINSLMISNHYSLCSVVK